MSDPDVPQKRGRRILNSTCSVCGSLASSHIHYGAISCYSCRAFFRRGLPRQTTCIFQTNKCLINCFNRTNCKRCRYNRCLEAGMKPDQVDAALRKRGSRNNSSSSSTSVQEEESQEDELSSSISQEEDIKDIKPDLNDSHHLLQSSGDYKAASPYKKCKYLVVTDQVINEVKSDELINSAEFESLRNEGDIGEKKKAKVELHHDSLEQSSTELPLNVGAEKCDNKCKTFSELGEGSMVNVDGLLNYYLEMESKKQESFQSNRTPVIKPLMSLQGHQHLQQIIYPVSAAINQKLSPTMGFTSEEDSIVKSLLYKRELLFEDYFLCLQSRLPTMHYHLIDLINSIRCNKTYLIEENVIQSIADVMKSINLKHMRFLFPEFSQFTTSYIENVLSSCCNALFSCFFAFLLCKNRNNRIVDQWVKFLIAPPLVDWILKAIPDLMTTRSCTLSDFEMFASPWAARIEDEEYFKSTINELVEVIDGDDTLIAMFALLIRVSPRVSQDMAVNSLHSCLKPIQHHICSLIYGYLRRQFSLDGHKASQATKRMQALVGKLHVCGDIFFRKRLIIMYQPNQLLEDLTFISG